jgi:hypothetical protein
MRHDSVSNIGDQWMRCTPPLSQRTLRVMLALANVQIPCLGRLMFLQNRIRFIMAQESTRDIPFAFMRGSRLCRTSCSNTSAFFGKCLQIRNGVIGTGVQRVFTCVPCIFTCWMLLLLRIDIMNTLTALSTIYLFSFCVGIDFKFIAYNIKNSHRRHVFNCWLRSNI